MFITFEGPDGSGKSTAIKSLATFLKNEGIDFILTREPGAPNSPESAAIREVITNKDFKIPPITEALLFAADRRMHIDSTIKPALKAGKVVLCDRYIDSSLAYQGAGRNLGINEIRQVNEIATEGMYPDLTIFFDIKYKDSLKRVNARESKDRMELSGKEFHERVYQGYMEVIEMFKDRFVLIDATKSREEVFEEVKSIVTKAINK